MIVFNPFLGIVGPIVVIVFMYKLLRASNRTKKKPNRKIKHKRKCEVRRSNSNEISAQKELIQILRVSSAIKRSASNISPIDIIDAKKQKIAEQNRKSYLKRKAFKANFQVIA